MSKRGGHRERSGRPRGSRNKATVEKALIVEQVVSRAQMTGRKLAKEVLDEFMHYFSAMAARAQPMSSPGMPVPSGRVPDEAKFEKWARLAVQCAKDLASYQSPTFRAIAVTSDVVDKGGGVRFVVENAPAMVEAEAE